MPQSLLESQGLLHFLKVYLPCTALMLRDLSRSRIAAHQAGPHLHLLSTAEGDLRGSRVGRRIDKGGFIVTIQVDSSEAVVP